MEHIIHAIGPMIREKRKSKKVSSNTLAASAGLSQAMLSKIENGRIIPTIPKLMSLISCLSISPAEFFQELVAAQVFDGYIHVKRADYKKYIKEESATGFVYESILEKSLASTYIQLSLVTLKPNNKRAMVSTNAFEYLYIIKGQMDFHLGDTIIGLAEGDSLLFDGKIPHVPLNKSGKEMCYLVAYLFNE